MVEPPNKPVIKEEDPHLLDYVIVLADHSHLIIYTSIAVMVLTYLLLFILPNKYTATARLLPPQHNMTLSAQLLNSMGGGPTADASAGGAFGGMAGVAAGLLGLRSPADLYVGIMTGNTIYDRIIARFNLRQIYQEKYIETTRKALNERVKIGTEKKGALIAIEVTDKSPKRAAEMANAFVEELDKLLRGMATQEAGDRSAFLEKERLRASQNLSKAEEALRTFSEKHSVLQIGTQTRGALEYIARLRAQIDAKEVEIGVLRQQAAPYNYDIVRLETEIKGLKEKLAAAEKQYDPSCLGDVCLTTSRVPTLGLEYMRLYREVKFQEVLYQLYTKLVELARLDLVKDFSVVQVVDRALPPEKRSNKRLLPALLAGIVTCFTMILVAFGLEYWQAVKNREEETHRIAFLKKALDPWFKIFKKPSQFLRKLNFTAKK